MQAAPAGYSGRVADSGQTALAPAAGDESAIDLLVTDVVTREMGGRQLAAEVAKRKPAHVAFLAKSFAPTALPQKARDIVDDPI